MNRLHLAALLMLLALTPAAAEACQWTTSEPLVDTLVEPRHYVIYTPCQTTCMWDMWVYEETNGLDGLQRRDEIRDDTCGGQIPGDTIIL